MEVEKVGTVVVIRMNNGENRITPDFIAAFHEALDKAEAYKDATALVTIGEGKFYSLGLDLELITGFKNTELSSFLLNVQRLLHRLLTFPMVTVAALNGHAFAGGAVIAMTHDHLIMHSEKGWFCLPEVNLKLQFPVGLLKLAIECIPKSEHTRCIVLGKRYTAEEAKAAGIIQEVSSLEKLKDSAIAAARRLAGEGLDRQIVSTMKRDLHHDLCTILNEPLRTYSRL